MAGLLIRVPEYEFTYVPAVEPVAAREAYCQTEMVLVGYREEPQYSGGSGGGVVAEGVSYSWSSAGNDTPVPSRLIPRYRMVRTCYPEQKAVAAAPARTDLYEKNGWNCGARSVEPVPVGSYIQVQIPLIPRGVIVGLSDGQFDHGYGHPSHAMVARKSGITPIEYGVDVGPEKPLGRVLRIIRHQNGVRMLADNQVVYDSGNLISGKAYGDVTLYSASDYVDEALIGAYHETGGVAIIQMTTGFAEEVGGVAAMTLELEALALRDGVALSAGVASLQVQLIAVAHAIHASQGDSELQQRTSIERLIYTDKSGTLSVGADYGFGAQGAVGKGMMGVCGDYKPMYGRGAFAPSISSGRLNRPEDIPWQGSGVFPPGIGRGKLKVIRKMQGSGAIGAVGKGSESMLMTGSALVASVYRGVNWWSYVPPWVLDVGQVVTAVDSIVLQGGALFVIAESLQAGKKIDLFMVVNFEIAEFVGASTDASLAFIVQMAIEERVRLSSAAADARKEALQYAVNAVTGALSIYRNFGFKQFARMGGDTYAITDAGLYRLGGEGDDGETLDAFIDFGSSDMGTSRSKRVSSIYAGIATDGTVYLRVSGDDGVEQVYRAVGDGVERRARTAKGLTARHWRVRLELVDASYAELDNIEIELGVSQRRLRGGK